MAESSRVQVSGVPAVLFGPRLTARTMNALDRDEEMERKAMARGVKYTSKLTEEDVAPRGSAFKHAKKLGNESEGRVYRTPASATTYRDMFQDTLRIYPNARVVQVSIRGKRNKGFPLLRQTIFIKGKRYTVVNAIYPERAGRAYGLVCLNPV